MDGNNKKLRDEFLRYKVYEQYYFVYCELYRREANFSFLIEYMLKYPRFYSRTNEDNTYVYYEIDQILVLASLIADNKNKNTPDSLKESEDLEKIFIALIEGDYDGEEILSDFVRLIIEGK